MQTVTINFPEKIYGQLERQSQITRRTVADEVTAVVVGSLTDEILPENIEEELAQLEMFADDELLRAAQLASPPQKSDRMQELVEKQQLEGLTEAEKQEAQLLSQFFNRVMLVRSKAAVLLKERGYDVNSFTK
jgi:hypothetical protein